MTESANSAIDVINSGESERTVRIQTEKAVGVMNLPERCFATTSIALERLRNCDSNASR